MPSVQGCSLNQGRGSGRRGPDCFDTHATQQNQAGGARLVRQLLAGRPLRPEAKSAGLRAGQLRVQPAPECSPTSAGVRECMRRSSLSWSLSPASTGPTLASP
jgi:hypothetical protein